MNSINAITQSLLADSEKKAAQIVAEATDEAQRIISGAVNRAEDETAGILRQYEEKAQSLEKQGALREAMERRSAVMSVRQELVDLALDMAYERCRKQSADEWLKLLRERLEKSEKDSGGEKPGVIVSRSLYKKAKKALGDAYAVEEGSIENGFILSFRHYDLNYEPDRVFTGLREELELIAAESLFEDDDYEGV